MFPLRVSLNRRFLMTADGQPFFIWPIPRGSFDASNARQYGRWIGKRYREYPNLFWILGGDRNPDGFEALWTAMAEGIKEGDGASHLMTYHPRGQGSSMYRLHDIPWLDFNMIQSGHARTANNKQRSRQADRRTRRGCCFFATLWLHNALCTMSLAALTEDGWRWLKTFQLWLKTLQPWPKAFQP